MRNASLTLLPVLGVLAACATAPSSQTGPHEAYALSISHPSAHSSYLHIAPAAPGAPLPALSDVQSRGFSNYLRRRTGCALSSAYPVTPLGSAAVPAGYMVPVSC